MKSPHEKALHKKMGKKVGTIHERTIHGGWEKIRGDAPESDMKHYSGVHKAGQFKGQPMYKFRPNK